MIVYTKQIANKAKFMWNDKSCFSIGLFTIHTFALLQLWNDNEQLTNKELSRSRTFVSLSVCFLKEEAQRTRENNDKSNTHKIVKERRKKKKNFRTLSLVFLVMNEATTGDSRYKVSVLLQCIFLKYHRVVDWLHALACSGSKLAFDHITRTQHTAHIHDSPTCANIFLLQYIYYIFICSGRWTSVLLSIPIQMHDKNT